MTGISTQTIDDFLGDLASRSSTPGGGSLAAINAAEAAALMAMVIEFSGEDLKAHLAGVKDTIEYFKQLADDDITAFRNVMKFWKDGSPEEQANAALEAAEVPRRLINIANELLPIIVQLADRGNKNLISDVAIAADLLVSVFRASDLNILINLPQRPEAFEAAMSTSASAQRQLTDLSQAIRESLT